MNVQTSDGRVLSGTALEIVQAMQRLAFGADRFSLLEYIAWTVANVAAMGHDMIVTGVSEPERAASLLDQLVAAGLLVHR